MQASFRKSVKQLEKEAKAKKQIVLNEEESSEIKECFDLFDTNKTGYIQTKELKVAMRAVGFEFEKDVYKKIIKETVEDGVNVLDYSQFLQIMTKHYCARDTEEEYLRSFRIFDNGETGKIGFSDLKRVAKELGENMTDEEIMEMIEETDQNNDKEIDFDEFKRIMRETNLFHND